MVVISKKRKLIIRREKRIIIVTFAFFLLGLIIIFRLFILQILQHNFYLSLASKSQEVYKDLFPKRGRIFVKEEDKLYPIISNFNYYLLYAEPNKIKNPAEIVDNIIPILGLSEKEWKKILDQLNKINDPYEPVKHKITEEQMIKIKDLGLIGIDFLPESHRYYPEKDFSGQILGFIGYVSEEKKGLYGLEGYFDKELAGISGMIQSTKDALGSLITIGKHSIKKAKDGVDLVLTIDRKIQFTVCQELKNYIERFGAGGGSVIVMAPQTGAILAMCSFPDFEPANYETVADINYFNNPAIFYAYEPGSVFKAITMAAGLDSGLITPQTTYIDEGEVKVGPYIIRNSDNQAHGELTMLRAFELSLNTGFIFIADKIGNKIFKEYVKSFGFGKTTGITLNMEVGGDISSLNKKGEIYTLTASYGQGITVTPLQLLAAYAAIANQGKLVKPYIVSEIIDGDNKITTQPQIVGEPISSKTASVLTGMLISVVENGWGKKAKVDGYYVAGKTGTAEIASPTGGYSHDTIHTFVGFAPADNPKFVTLTKLNNPTAVSFAADSVAPLFGKLAKFLLNYYQVPPER